MQKPQRPDTRDMQKPATRDVPKQKPQQKPIPSGDRGYGGNTRDMQPQQRPSAQPAPMNRPTPSGSNKANKGTAMSGAGGNRQGANAASQRGQQSMPQGARSKGGGGGNKKQAR